MHLINLIYYSSYHTDLFSVAHLKCFRDTNSVTMICY